MGIAQRYTEIACEVERTCLEAGRPANGALLLAVSKTVGIDGVAQAIEAGAMDFGENRPDQLVEKHEAFPEARWHFIGNIQSRRIRDIVPCAHLIHSLHKMDHARKIDALAKELGKVQDVLVEVNVSGEESKSGISPEDAMAFVEECLSMKSLRVRGFMTMAPQGDESVAEECFMRLASLKNDVEAQLSDGASGSLEAFDQLSMGMSEDWQAAIRQGSTIVRIGRAIFSEEF